MKSTKADRVENRIGLDRVYALLEAYRSGRLGGEKMPEEENPGLDRGSLENYIYFTLPMALNYQRNSYILWECANKAWHDEGTRDIYSIAAVADMSDDELREKLMRHKVALQRTRHPNTWKTLCRTFRNDFGGDVRRLLWENEYSVQRIKAYMTEHRKEFPYLSGNKISNYWLYVLEQYTDTRFTDREYITVAPDTHVIQASVQLGVISREEVAGTKVQKLVAARWQELLKGTELAPIDLHTPLWLWSRGKFQVEI